MTPPRGWVVASRIKGMPYEPAYNGAVFCSKEMAERRVVNVLRSRTPVAQ